MKFKKTYIFTIIAIFISQIIYLNVPAESIQIEAEVYFSPQSSPKGGCIEHILYNIKKAKKTIFIQSYSFTSKEIAQALIDAASNGVKVILLIDSSYSKKPLTYKMSENFQVFVDKIEGIAHNKVIIIDDEIVITGSYNFSYAAENKNAENLLILKSRKLNKIYKENFFYRIDLKSTYELIL